MALTQATKVGAHLATYAPQGVPRTVEDKLKDIASIVDYGAVSGQDCTSAIRAAVSALGATGGVVFLPKGKWVVSERIELQQNIHVVGEGQGCSVILDKTINTGLFKIGTPQTNVNNVYIRDLQIIVENTNTGGRLVELTNGYNCGLQRVRIDGPFYDGIFMIGGPQQFIYRIEDCIINGDATSNDAITIGDTTSLVQDVFLSNIVASNVGGCCVKEVYASGVYANNIDCLMGKYGYAWLPEGSTYCRGSFYTAVLGDTCSEYGLIFDPKDSGYVSDLNLNGCWGSSCGSTVDHSGLYINADTNKVSNLNFNGLSTLNNKGAGVVIKGQNAHGINLVNIGASANSMVSSGAKSGIELYNTRHINITNVKAGTTPAFSFNNQNYGLSIIDCSDINLSNMLLEGNVSGGLYDPGGLFPTKVKKGSTVEFAVGQTSIFVDPQMGTLAQYQISVFPLKNPQDKSWWVHVEHGATTFEIKMDSAPSGEGVWFSWSVDKTIQ